MAVIGFRNSMDGFKDAEAFDNSFYHKKRGRRDFDKDFPHECGTHLYGWMATKKVCPSSLTLLYNPKQSVFLIL